ncbi:hypothetical protein KILIM_091_00020 [Kineosphaera limosa NBRC 100340]|uniref:Uncharacterized protein n=2 Tax=Kineosphaera TaxID=211469 RepID=K6X0S4_9MICO|nr:hypothetical protein KILIM_091_00020 [Kineosphaera limosa NBRC 100340]
MESGFRLAHIFSQPPIPITPFSGIRKPIYESTAGPLLESDKRLLEKFSGMEFDWPPAPGQPFPGDATGIAQMRQQQRAAGMSFKGDLMAGMSRLQNQYQRMSGNGIFSDEFMQYVAERSPDSPAAYSQLRRLSGIEFYG